LWLYIHDHGWMLDHAAEGHVHGALLVTGKKGLTTAIEFLLDLFCVLFPLVELVVIKGLWGIRI
jgi:hypothetical protein